MVNFSTYALAGIGVASVIGFVFALSFLGNNNISLTDHQQESYLLMSQLKQSDGQEPASDTQGMPEGLMMQQAQDLRPSLTSITVLNTNREIIGEVMPEVQFEINKPVLIQANLFNPSEAEIRQHTIVLGISSDEEGFDEQLVNFQGDIAGNGNTTLELHWSPDREGDYTLLLFSMTPNDLASTEPTKPIAAIPVKVG